MIVVSLLLLMAMMTTQTQTNTAAQELEHGTELAQWRGGEREGVKTVTELSWRTEKKFTEPLFC